jgi:hypothetical protein
MIWLLIGIYVVIVVLEMPAIIKNHMYREMWTFMAFFVVGLYMSLAQLYGWPLYNPFSPFIAMLAGIY